MIRVMRTLVTGFGPFGSVVENPSAKLAECSDRRYAVIEVSYEAAREFVETLDGESFDLWMMLGVAADRKVISIETLGRNQKAGRDVRGVVASGPIDPSLPSVLSASLWSNEKVRELTEAFPSEIQVSDDAGSYLCNYLTFCGLSRFPEKRIGFLHVVSPERIALKRQSEIISAVLASIERP